ncbi:MAG: diguanylate cyclase, partial [Myxococcota bacterium]
MPAPAGELDGCDGMRLAGVGVRSSLRMRDETMNIALLGEKTLGQTIAKILSERGHTAARVSVDVQPLLHLEDAERAPDLVLIDLAAGKNRALEFLMRVRGREPTCELPVLVLAAPTARETLEIALSLGADDFLMKPLDELAVASRIAHIVTLTRRAEDLYGLATTDELTGLANRRHFKEQLDREVARAKRYGHPLAVAVMDVDHFKAVNDAHGHAAGDRMLVALSQAALRTIRATDIIGRMGGEEFGFGMPETTLHEARRVCDRLRRKMSSCRMWVDEAEISRTVSIGVTALRSHQDNFDTLLERADMA